MLKGLGILELSFMIQPVVRKCGNASFLHVAGGPPAALTRQPGARRSHLQDCVRGSGVRVPVRMGVPGTLRHLRQPCDWPPPGAGSVWVDREAQNLQCRVASSEQLFCSPQSPLGRTCHLERFQTPTGPATSQEALSPLGLEPHHPAL